ncbi:MAG: phosphatase PAP2 family protein [Bacteroidetes bacterium]|nr:phosphatase PAP2 family protein [Bacteroidota bacterium]
MKKIFSIITTTAIISSVLYISCSKNIVERTDNLPALNPVSQDLNAGTWKTVLVSSPDNFSVAPPPATNSSAYLADLNEIKGYQQSLSDAELNQIKYWGAGGVLRWNEIMRELVAKHNLPPYQLEDGTYPAPSATNPFNYPEFPFSNPPYAARAFAYLSAAQYDALVTCWHFKKLYNQPAPYTVDGAINAINGKSDLPSYPSEAAVLAGVTSEIMKMMFPTEIANIQQKVEAEELAAIQSGAATRSDITAGEALGRQIAALFTARAKADHAGTSGGNPDVWNSFVTNTSARGETPWYSLEVPKRPPMLPLFGSVLPFLFDSSTIALIRPGYPFSTESGEFLEQNQDAYQQIKNPTREQERIVQYWADGVGTYTPTGHWNAIAAEDFIQQNYSEVRWARNMALLNMGQMDAAIVCWDTKYFYFNPRPTQIIPSIKTLTGIPNFPSYISGHSTFSESASTILGHIIPANAGKYEAFSAEAAQSRFIAGIHTKMDCDSGMVAGKRVGEYAIARAKSDGAE